MVSTGGLPAPPLHGRIFTGFIVAMMAAAAVYAAVALWLDVEADDEAMSRRVIETAKLASERTEHYFDRWQPAFAAISEHECLRRQKQTSCDDLFARLNRRFPDVVNFAAIDRDGHFIASGRSGGDRPNARQLPFFRELAAGRPRDLMDPHRGPLSGEWVSGAVMRLADSDGRFDGLIGISVRFSDLQNLWHNNKPYPDVDLMVLNRAGRIIHPPADQPMWDGKMARDVGLPDLRGTSPAKSAGDGHLDFELDGARYVAYRSQVAAGDWTVIALRRVTSPLAGYVASERIGLKLFLPLALLTLIGGVLALRSQLDRRRAIESEARLHQSLTSTERQVKDRTRLLAESELRYRALFEESPNGVVMIDTAGRILEFNHVAAASLGYSDAEFSRLSIHDLEASELPRDEVQHLTRIVETGQDTFETRLCCKSGHCVDMLVSVRRVMFSSGPVVIAVWTDLTPVVQIQQLQKRLQTIVEASRDGIVLADHRGVIVYANPAIETLLGWNARSLTGQPISTLVPPELRQAHAAGFNRALTSGHTLNQYPKELDAMHHKGNRVPIEIAMATWNEEGQPFFSAVLRDLSERRQAQERLQFTQKMEAVGILAGGIAHDFNNLLAIMLGHGQLIHDRAPEGDPNRASAEKINKAVVKARALIKQLLDFSRATDEAPKALSLADEIREVEALIRSSVPRQIELRISTAGTIGAIRAIPHQMQQVFINLINNACDAIGDTRGIVDVKLAEETVQHPVATADGQVPPGCYVVARVLDNGPGISEAIHDRIFLPFFTTKDVGRGTGLGLAVVRNIVRQGGGHVRVFNRLSGGACFELYFPTVEAAPVEAPASQPEFHGRGETVWFVDDEPEVVEAYAQFLTESGFKPRVFDSPAAALAELGRHPHEAEIIISDLIMPGMDGLEFAHAAHKTVPNLPVLLLTGRSERVTIEQMKTCGVAGLIAKPAEPSLIAAEVRRTLDRGPRMRAAVL